MNMEMKVKNIAKDLQALTNQVLDGVYVHGSLTLGGYQEGKSDIDLMAITSNPLSRDKKEKVIDYLLTKSTHAYPIEISFMTREQLDHWCHPSPFDLHYSEWWRERFEKNKIETILSQEGGRDPDLAAHLAVLHKCGRTMIGPPVPEAFPIPERNHVISSLLYDSYNDWEDIVTNPSYLGLNLLRFYRYLKEGTICSKLEGGHWGKEVLPIQYHKVMSDLVVEYQGGHTNFHKDTLLNFAHYVKRKLDEELANIGYTGEEY